MGLQWGASPAKLRWSGDQSVLLLNPRMAEEERTELLRLAEKFSQESHYWIASSGSSRTAHESVKLCALSFGAVLSSAHAVNEHISASSADRWLRPLPLWHVGGLGIHARAYLTDSAVIEMPDDKWNPQVFHEQVSSERVTLTSLVPTQIFDLLEAGMSSPTCLRAIFVGGAALEPDLYFRARQAGWPLLPSYGMSEMCSQIATAELKTLEKAPNEFPALRVLDHVDLRVDSVDERLCVRGPSLMTGFAQQRETETLWSEPFEKDRWFKTEDRAQLWIDGEARFLRPLGRGGQFIKISGEGVSLSRIQSLWNEFYPEGLRHTYVYFRSHDRKGAELVLLVDSKSSSELREAAPSVVERFNQKVLPFERLQAVVALEIPRSELGKVLTGELSARL